MNITNNDPSLWQAHFPTPTPEGNKYDRGHAVIMGGGIASTGATKLAARAALRVGAGLVSVACDMQSLPIYGAFFQAVMTKLTANAEEFSALITDNRVTAVLVGCGCGVSEKTKAFALFALSLKKPVVLDADALTVFEINPQKLFYAINSPSSSNFSCILTPHDGEFTRLFGGFIEDSDRVEKARKAAKLSGAVVVLKGFNTIIAAPDGRVAVNNNSTPYLATAGSGDVLAGICVGLLAQSMPAFEAACAGVWLHSEVARNFGAGLIAEDIAELLPKYLQKIINLPVN